MEYRSETVGYELRKVEDVRLCRWTSVGCAGQVVWCAGTKGALLASSQKVWACAQRRFHVVLMRNRELV